MSRESVRRLRRALGLPAGIAAARPAPRRRPREAAAGQLVQLDGSPFDWLEARGPRLTLLGAIDDATSEVVALHFRPTEDVHGYVTLLRQVFTSVGLPVALYGNGINILVRNDATGISTNVDWRPGADPRRPHAARTRRRIHPGALAAGQRPINASGNAAGPARRANSACAASPVRGRQRLLAGIPHRPQSPLLARPPASPPRSGAGRRAISTSC